MKIDINTREKIWCWTLNDSKASTRDDIYVWILNLK